MIDLRTVLILQIKVHDSDPRDTVEERRIQKLLTASIKKHGLASPLKISHEFILIDGRRRLKAMKECGCIEVAIEVLHFTPEQIEEAKKLTSHPSYRKLTMNSVLIIFNQCDGGLILYSLETTRLILRQLKNIHGKYVNCHELSQDEVEFISSINELPDIKKIFDGTRDIPSITAIIGGISPLEFDEIIVTGIA